MSKPIQPGVLAYRYAIETGPFSWVRYDGFLHGWQDAASGDDRWVDACRSLGHTPYHTAVQVGFAAFNER